MTLQKEASSSHAFLAGGGILANDILAFDWSKTPLGPITSWPTSLKTTVGLILRSSLPIVTLWGEEGTMIYNDAYSVFAGGRHPQLLGSAVRAGWPEVADFNDNVMKVCLSGGTLSYKDQELTLHRTGKPEQVWMNLDYSSIVGENGRPTGVIAIVVETTAKVLAERELREEIRQREAERDRQLRLFEQAPAFIVIMRGSDHRIEFVNNQHRIVFNSDDWPGQTIREAIPSLSGQGFFEQLDWVYETGRTYRAQAAEVSFRARRDAPENTYYLTFIFAPLHDDDGRISGVFCEGFDVTEAHISAQKFREKLEAEVAERTRAIAQSEKTIRTIFETSYMNQGLLTTEGKIVYVNATSLASINSTFDEVVGKNFWETPWFTGTPGMSEKVREGIAQVAAGQSIQIAMPLNMPTGHRIYEFSMRPAIDDLGAVIALVPEAVEITARVRAEEALRQSQKVEAIGNLTGGIAHDFNNLLMVIQGSLELLRRRLPNDPTIMRFIDNAVEGTRRGKSLTERMLAFARKHDMNPQRVSVGQLVSGMLDLLKRSLGSMVSIDVEVADHLSEIEVDPNQLENALLNLALNARDALNGKGSIMISAREEIVANDHDGLKPGNHVCLSVSDTGEGMSEETLKRATEPFFTTKGIGRGTGLGLSMVYGFAEQSGGKLRLKSKPGVGTTAEIWFPAKSTPGQCSDAPESTRPGKDASTERLHVLAVDDDPLILRSIADMLEDLGHSAVTAPSATDALKRLNDGKFDLLITDHAMPHMTGAQLVAQVLEKYPGMSAILATGYAELPAGIRPDALRLSKPFSQNDLRDALANARHRSLEKMRTS